MGNDNLKLIKCGQIYSNQNLDHDLALEKRTKRYAVLKGIED